MTNPPRTLSGDGDPPNDRDRTHGRELPRGNGNRQVDEAVSERENVELRRANEILRHAAAFFAAAELDRRPR